MAVQVTSAGEIPQGADRVSVRDSGGTLYVFVNDAGTLRAFKGNNTGIPTSFSEADTTNLPNEGNDLGLIGITAAIDSADKVSVMSYFADTLGMNPSPTLALYQFNTVSAASSQDNWQNSGTIINSIPLTDDAAGFGNVQSLSIRVDTNDDLHVFWTDSIKDMGSSITVIYYSNRISGSWKARVLARQTASVSLDVYEVSSIISVPTASIGEDRPIMANSEEAISDSELTVSHGNALNATSFVNEAEPSVGQTLSEFESISMTTNGSNIYVAVISGTLDLVVTKHAGGNSWTTGWSRQNVSTINDYSNPSVALFRYPNALGAGALFFYAEAITGGDTDDIIVLWARHATSGSMSFTRKVLEAGTFNTPNVKWARYNDTQSTGTAINQDIVYEDGSAVRYNTFNELQIRQHTTNAFLRSISQERTHETSLVQGGPHMIGVKSNASMQGRRNTITLDDGTIYNCISTYDTIQFQDSSAADTRIEMRKSTDNGLTWSNTLDRANQPSGVDRIHPSIDRDSNGLIHMVYIIMLIDGGVNYRTFNTSTDTWSTDTELQAYSAVEHDKNNTEGATSIAVDINDDVHVVWNRSNVTPVQQGFYSNNITGGGTTFKTPVNITSTFDCRSPVLIFDEDDFPALIFNASNLTDVYFSAGNAINATSFTNFALALNGISGSLRHGIARRRNGDILAAYRASGNVINGRIHTSGDAPATWGTEFSIRGANTIHVSAYAIGDVWFTTILNNTPSPEELQFNRITSSTNVDDLGSPATLVPKHQASYSEGTTHYHDANVSPNYQRYGVPAQINVIWRQALLASNPNRQHITDHVFLTGNDLPVKTHTTDSFLAVVDAAQTRVHTTDALLLEHQTETHTTDALLQKHIEITHTTDALLATIITLTHTTDSLLKKFGIEIVHTTDSLLKKFGIEVDHTTDALLEAHQELTHTTDSLLKKFGIEVTHTTDSLLKKLGSGSTGCFIDTTELEAYIEVNNDVVDSSGNGNDGTWFGSEQYATGKVPPTTDGAMDLIDSNHVRLANPLNFEYTRTDPFSINVWVKTTSTDANVLVAKKFATGVGTGWAVFQRSGGGQVIRWLIANGSTSWIVDSTVSINDDAWHMVTVTYTGLENQSGMRIYIDGVLNNRGTGNVITGDLTTAFNVSLGAFGTGNNTMTGDQDDHAIFSRLLSDAEVRYIYNNNSPVSIIDPSRTDRCHDTESVLKKLDNEITHTTDSLLVQKLTLTHTTDSFLLKHQTLTHTTDSLLLSHETRIHTTDSLLKKFGIELTHTTDSFLRKTIELTHTTDSLLKKLGILITHTTDTALQRVDNLLTHTTDAFLRKTIELTHTTDSLLKKFGIEITHTTDSLLKKLGILLTHTTDAFLRKTLTLTHTTDAVLLSFETRVHTTDAFLKIAVGHSTDAFLKRAIAHSTDAFLEGLAPVVTHTTDALLLKIQTLTHTTDSLLKKIIELTHTTDSLLEAHQTLTHTTDALLLKIQTLTHTTDSLLKKLGLTVTHTTDSLLKKLGQTLTHTTDSLLQRVDNLLTHTTDSLLLKIQTLTHTTDAFLKKTQTLTHTTDSLLKKFGLEVTHTTDAFLSGIGIDHTTDAFLKLAVGHSTDALLLGEEERTHTTDAKLVLDVSVTHTTDSLLKRGQKHTTNSLLVSKFVIVSSVQFEIPQANPVRLTHTTDAKLVGPIELTHTTDAKLIVNQDVKVHSTNSALVSTFAIISSIQFEIPLKRPVRLTHTTDSTLRVGVTISHGTNSFLANVFGITHTTDAGIQKVDNLVTHTTDSLLNKVATEITHTTDSVLKKLGQLVTHTTDAFLEDKIRITHTTDSLLKKFGVIVSHTTDAGIQLVDNLRTHTTDAFLNKLRTLTHTTDSLLGDFESIRTHTTDALLAGLGRTRTHTTDAVIQEAGTLTHTTDAYIQVKEAAAFNILAFKREERRTLPFQREERNTLTFQRDERENVAFQ